MSSPEDTLTPPGAAPPARALDRQRVLDLYLGAAEVHPYGIADVAQLWDVSRWWQDGPAVVGLLDLPGAQVPVLYAVPAGVPAATLDLLGALEPWLPDRFEATGPRGMAARLGTYRPVWVRDCLKLHLADPARLPPPDRQVVTLTRADLDDLARLFATDEHAGDFFHPGLLDSGLYVGVRAGGELVASAGIHVVDERHGVAAIGNVATHPAHRRRGHARAATATLCHRLLGRVRVVGLNVREDNVAARRLYAAIGFRTVATYEEAQVVRQRASS